MSNEKEMNHEESSRFSFSGHDGACVLDDGRCLGAVSGDHNELCDIGVSNDDCLSCDDNGAVHEHGDVSVLLSVSGCVLSGCHVSHRVLRGDGLCRDDEVC